MGDGVVANLESLALMEQSPNRGGGATINQAFLSSLKNKIVIIIIIVVLHLRRSFPPLVVYHGKLEEKKLK